MNRQIKENYIPLTSSDLGESHKLVLMLCEDQGLVRAAVFGAKGKKSGPMRALIQPFSLCRGDLYHDPVKKLWRLKEGECLKSRDGFHGSLNKYYAALFWSDLIIQTYAGGGSRDFFSMSDSLFSLLNDADAGEVPGIFLSALWEYLELEGIQPDTGGCSRCGRRAPVGQSVCYNDEGQVVCSRCRVGTLPLLTGSARSLLESGRPAEGTPLRIASGLDGPGTMESLTGYIMTILQSIVRLKMDRNSLKIILNQL